MPARSDVGNCALDPPVGNDPQQGHGYEDVEPLDSSTKRILTKQACWLCRVAEVETLRLPIDVEVAFAFRIRG